VKPPRAAAVIVGALLVLGACTASSSGSVAPIVPASLGATIATSTTPGPSPTASASSGGGDAIDTPEVTNIDPCTLLTDAQASTLASVTLSPGKRGTGGGSNICSWAAAVQGVTITLIQPGDIVTAQVAYAAALQADAKAASKSGGTLTKLPTFDDGGYIFRSAANGRSISAIGVLDGAYFVIVEANVPGGGPDDNALKFAATLAVGALP
jgi:Protein of unknown function (DUF3558)